MWRGGFRQNISVAASFVWRCLNGFPGRKADRLSERGDDVAAWRRDDVIMTGTPFGVGPVKPGDVVDIEISGIGILSNPVIAEV